MANGKTQLGVESAGVTMEIPKFKSAFTASATPAWVHYSVVGELEATGTGGSNPAGSG